MTGRDGASPAASAVASRVSASANVLASSCCASSTAPGLDIIARQTSSDIAPTPSGSNGFFTALGSYHRFAGASRRRAEAVDEVADALHDEVRVVAMRAVPRARHHQDVGLGGACRDRVDLREGAVLVVLA